MADQTPPDLQDRLDQFSQRGKSRRRGTSLGVGALAAALALGGAGVAYFLATGLQTSDSALETSDVETFQDRRPGTGCKPGAGQLAYRRHFLLAAWWPIHCPGHKRKVGWRKK